MGGEVRVFEQSFYAEAQRFKARAQEYAEKAESWSDFDRWDMSAEERAANAARDAALANVYATLSLTAATQDK